VEATVTVLSTSDARAPHFVERVAGTRTAFRRTGGGRTHRISSNGWRA
jgi:hypothetical protein